ISAVLSRLRARAQVSLYAAPPPAPSPERRFVAVMPWTFARTGSHARTSHLTRWPREHRTGPRPRGGGPPSRLRRPDRLVAGVQATLLPDGGSGGCPRSRPGQPQRDADQRPEDPARPDPAGRRAEDRTPPLPAGDRRPGRGDGPGPGPGQGRPRPWGR